MFNLDKFIADSVTKRPVSMFAADIEANKETLLKEIKDIFLLNAEMIKITMPW